MADPMGSEMNDQHIIIIIINTMRDVWFRTTWTFILALLFSIEKGAYFIRQHTHAHTYHFQTLT